MDGDDLHDQEYPEYLAAWRASIACASEYLPGR